MINKLKYFAIGVITTIILTTGVSTFAAGSISQQIKVFYSNIKVVVDGSPASMGKDSSGKVNEPFIYNGTTYLPIRAVSEALGKDVSWDNKTSTVFVGEKPGQVNYLMQYGYDGSAKVFDGKSSDSFTMGGKSYNKGYVFGWFKDYQLFNLNGQFSQLTFEYGSVRIESLNKNDYLEIYLDDELFETITIPTGQLPKEYVLPVKGVNQVKFIVNNKDSHFGEFGIGNPIVQK